MTSLRKWRFPILIGSGLIAAGVLFYFSKTHVSSDKTQGAIGKRDVYRDGQVNSADVATPGSAPVATQAILESSEFKSLAKNPAFQELMKNQCVQRSFPRTDRSRRLLPTTRISGADARQQMFAELVQLRLVPAGLRLDLQSRMNSRVDSSESQFSGLVHATKHSDAC